MLHVPTCRSRWVVDSKCWSIHSNSSFILAVALSSSKHQQQQQQNLTALINTEVWNKTTQ